MDPRDKQKLLESLNELTLSQSVFLTRGHLQTYDSVLKFFRLFNNFSSLYQSFAENIKRDVNAKREIEVKLIS
jgi:hypothetical protein